MTPEEEQNIVKFMDLQIEVNKAFKKRLDAQSTAIENIIGVYNNIIDTMMLIAQAINKARQHRWWNHV